ncbi:MAG: hypothetical protein QM736_16035 [Vicinamibacterales bacterium]
MRFSAARAAPRRQDTQCILAEHAWPRVALRHCDPLVEDPFRVGRAAGTHQRRPGLEPEQTVPWILRAQTREHGQRIVVALFAVVEQQERDHRVRLVVARIVRRGFDQRDATFASAAEACDVGHPPHRHRHRRHQITIGADDQPRVGARRLLFEDTFVFRVRFARGSERRDDSAVDRRDVRGPDTDGCAEVVVRLRIAWTRRHVLASEVDCTCDSAMEFVGERLRRWRQRDVACRHTTEVAVHRHRAASHRDVRHEGAREPSPCCGILRIDRRGLTPCREATLAIEVVDLFGRFGAQGIGRGIGLARTRVADDVQRGECDGQNPPSHV